MGFSILSEVRTMDICKMYQQQIPAFQNDNMTYKEEKAFLTHVTECDDCREELEIYCIIEYGLNDYDESKIHPQYRKFLGVFDFRGLVEQRLKDRNLYVEWYSENEKIMNLVTTVSNVILLIVALVLIIIKFF
jgi:hypothetical protein